MSFWHVMWRICIDKRARVKVHMHRPSLCNKVWTPVWTSWVSTDKGFDELHVQQMPTRVFLAIWKGLAAFTNTPKTYSSLYNTCHCQLTVVNKKLSYRRDSARWRSLRPPRLIKVTDIGTSLPIIRRYTNNQITLTLTVRKRVCDTFISVNNTNLHPTLHRFPVIMQHWSNQTSGSRATWYTRLHPNYPTTSILPPSLTSCGSCSTDYRQDKVGALLTCINGKLCCWSNAYVVM